MGDNETAAIVVSNEEDNGVITPNAPKLNSNIDKKEVDEEMKQFDDRKGRLLLDQTSTLIAGNDSKKFGSSEDTDTKLEGKIEPDKTQCVTGSKREDAKSEIESNVTNPKIQAANISNEEMNSEENDSIESKISVISGSTDLSDSGGHDSTTVTGKPRTTVKYVTRNQSNILPSLKQVPRNEDASMMIFSHKGLPAKSYFKKRDPNSPFLPIEIDERDIPSKQGRKNKVELTPKISQIVPKVEAERKASINPLSDRNPNIPTNSDAGISRNVLTGRGVNSIDEFKSKSARRKDGNPLLGIGYDEPVIHNNTGRVPPGGFSNGLW